jgi:hypothetical protein
MVGATNNLKNQVDFIIEWRNNTTTKHLNQNKMKEEECCPNCGECENIHTNYDWSKPDRPVEQYLCNECGAYFPPKSN